MIFDRFFKPKWQHANPEVRKQAILKLAPHGEDEALLLQLATQDPDADVRRTAIKRVSALEFLRRRANEDGNAGVREVAGARYRQLLTGGIEEGGLELRLAELALCEDESVLSHVARRAREAEMRLAALSRVLAPHVLEEAVLNDTSARVRQAALARLHEPAALERIARLTRERDRKVARQAKEMLDELNRQAAEHERTREQRADVCRGLETLAEGGWHAGIGAEIVRLQNRWQAVARPADADLEQRYRQAVVRAQALAAPEPAKPVATVAPVGPVVSDGADLLAELDAIVAGLQSAPAIDEQRLLECQQRLQSIQDRWEAQPDSEREDHYRYHLKLLQGYLESAGRYLAHEAELDAALGAVAAVEHGDDDALRAAARALRGAVERIEWELPLPPPALLSEARRQLDALAAELEQAVQQHAEQRAVLASVLEELEAHLDAGRLKESQRQLQRAQQLVEQLPAAERERAQRRLRGFSGRVAELADWKRFATLPKQEELCRRMEALIDADIEPAERAALVKALQDEWKATGGSGSPEGQRLWARFRTAADQAFEPCRGYFDELARQRQAHLEQRQRLCEQLESFIAQADWERLQPEALLAIRRQARNEWQAASPVDRKAGQALQDRFEALMDRLTAELQSQQDAHRQRKQALVTAARALAEGEDLRAAIGQVKELQAQWKEIGAAPPAVDHKLWREFRAACDAVFARRDRQREEVDQVRQTQQVQAETLCERAEAIARLADDALAAAEPELNSLDAEFQALETLPREQARALRQRLRQALDDYRERLRGLARRRRDAELDALRARAALCARLEALALASPAEAAGQLPALEAEWDAAPAVSAEHAARLAPRWQGALIAARAGGFASAELEGNREARRQLCVRMEILTGRESPAEDRALRMDLQVQRLAQGMGEGVREHPGEQARELELQWLAAGPAPLESGAALEVRFAAAREAGAGR